MRSMFTTCRARLAASATAILGLTAVGGCQQRSAPEPEVYAPQQAVTPVYIEESQVTTQAIGEEDGGYSVPTEQYATTYAVGEEDGTGPIPVEPNGGIGDGAGPIPFEQSAPQIGGVEGDYERIYIPPDPDNVGQPYNDGLATTLAIGEEG